MSAEAESAHYRQHRNELDDTGYRAFLSRLWEPMKLRLPTGASGLDYGSGPGPTLHLMAEADGFACVHYDPCFHPDIEALERSYDFITYSETAEHFHRPADEFARLAGMLRPHGWLGVMTTRYCDGIDFAAIGDNRPPRREVYLPPTCSRAGQG